MYYNEISFSLILPCYNIGRYLKKCLDSIYANRGIEGSSDNEIQIWTEHEQNIGVRPHKEKINISKKIINKTRGAEAPYAARMNHKPLRGEQQATVLWLDEMWRKIIFGGCESETRIYFRTTDV